MKFEFFRRMTPYERKVCLVLALSGLPNIFPSMMTLVTNYEPSYQCDYEAMFPNKTYLFGPEGSQSEVPITNFSHPVKLDSFGKETTDYCNVYVHTQMPNAGQADKKSVTDEPKLASVPPAARLLVPCDSFVFDTERGESSAVTEFGLVCGNDWAKKLAPTMLMLGMAIGCFSGGFLSDRFGRRRMFLLFTALQVLFTCTIGMSANATGYVIMMFFNGISTLVNYGAAAVLGYELVREEYRNLLYFGLGFVYAFGCLLFPLMSYFVRSWRWFCLATIMVGVPQIGYYWLIDESPKWLLATGQREKAELCLKKIAEYNGVKYNQEDLLEKEKVIEEEKPSVSLYTVWARFLRNPITVSFLLICMFAWCITNMTYFTVLLGSNSLSGNRFVNAALSGLVEMVSIAFSWRFLEFVDRRFSYMSVSMVGLVAVAIGPVLANAGYNVGTTIAALVVRMGSSIMFYILYVLTPEIFPTPIRQSAMMVCSGTSRVFAMLLPCFMYSENALVTCFIASFMMLLSLISFIFLPNTFNKPLPEDVDDCLKMRTGICARCTCTTNTAAV